MEYFINNLIVPFIIGLASSAVVVLFGVRSIKDHMRETERRRLIGKLEKFWKSQSDSKTFNIVFAAEWSGREHETEPRFGYAQAYGVSEIINCLNLVFGIHAVPKLVVVTEEDSLDPRLFDDNVVMLGGEYSIRKYGEISRAIDVPYYQFELCPKDRKMSTAKWCISKEVIFSKTLNGHLITDIGTVTRIRNPKNNNLIILFNGNYGAGLLGSILSVTANRSHLKNISEDARLSSFW